MLFIALGGGSCHDFVWDVEASPFPSPSLKFPSWCDKGVDPGQRFQPRTVENQLGPLRPGACPPGYWGSMNVSTGESIQSKLCKAGDLVSLMAFEDNRAASPCSMTISTTNPGTHLSRKYRGWAVDAQ